MNRTVYATDADYSICAICDEDRENYVELRRQINGGHTLFLEPKCKDLMWDQILNGEIKEFSIFDKNNEYCGNLEIQRPDSNTPELGIDLLENKRNMGITPRIIPLFIKRFLEDKEVSYFLIRISSENTHSRHVFEKMGAVLFGRAESEFKSFKKICEEVLESKFTEENAEILKQYFPDTSEESFVYEYKLIPEGMIMS